MSAFQGIRYVFLDRDGVVNRKAAEGEYVKDWREFEVLPGVERAIAALNRSGKRVILISNQRGIALGLYTAGQVEALHVLLQKHLVDNHAHIDAFYFCPHDEGQCTCRKPGAGLLEQAMREFPGISPAESVVIGDSLSDIEAAHRFGCRSIFILGDSKTRKPGGEAGANMADAVAASLPEAVRDLLGS